MIKKIILNVLTATVIIFGINIFSTPEQTTDSQYSALEVVKYSTEKDEPGSMH